jgi:hypothetical protein
MLDVVLCVKYISDTQHFRFRTYTPVVLTYLYSSVPGHPQRLWPWNHDSNIHTQ